MRYRVRRPEGQTYVRECRLRETECEDMSADVVPQTALTCSTDGRVASASRRLGCQPCRCLPCSSTRPPIKHHTARVTIPRRSRPGPSTASLFLLYRRLEAILQPLASFEPLLLLLPPSSICLNLLLVCGKPCIAWTERGVQLRPRSQLQGALERSVAVRRVAQRAGARLTPSSPPLLPPHRSGPATG